MPLTRPERTLVDLCLDNEDPSLIADAYLDTEKAGLDLARLNELVESIGATPGRRASLKALTDLMPATRKEAVE